MAAMPTAPPNAAGIELFYETFGEPDGEPLLFVMGLGAQAHVWDVELLEAFVDRGFYVIRFDNRDVGLSTKIEGVAPEVVAAGIMGAFGGTTPEAPYLLADMAADAVSLLDHLGLDSAHVVGASMGGMIVQQVVIDHPERVRSLTSIMSTTGDGDVGQPDPAAAGLLLQPPPVGRDEVIERNVETGRAIGSPDHFDEAAARRKAEVSYDRCFAPDGLARQLLAVLASPSRTEAPARRLGAGAGDPRRPRPAGHADRGTPHRGGDPGRRAARARGHGPRPAALLLAAGRRGRHPARRPVDHAGLTGARKR